MLKAAGLEGNHVVYDFLVNHITPFHLRPRPLWIYMDYTDLARTVRGRGSDLRDGTPSAAFRQLLGCDMPPVMLFSSEEGPLHHHPGKFDFISQMPKLGSLEP